MRKWIVLFGFIGTTIAPAGAVEIRDRIEFYEVQGSTAYELAAGMARWGPQQPSGRRAWAFTAWELRSTYELVAGADGCRLAGIGVTLDVVTTLPQWRAEGRPSWQLRARWQRMMSSIRKHEEVHKAHALDAARRTAASLATLPVQPECSNAERHARSMLAHEVKRARQLSRTFDHATDFGAHEGVGRLER